VYKLNVNANQVAMSQQFSRPPYAVVVDPNTGDCWVGTYDDDDAVGRVYKLDVNTLAVKATSPQGYEEIHSIAYSGTSGPPVFREHPGSWEEL
jgi:DNA-binding beta-propeller fold protein YncE